MFVVHVSYLTIPRVVAQCCHLPYVSLIHEVPDDGTDLYGIEVDLPSWSPQRVPRWVFFFLVRFTSRLLCRQWRGFFSGSATLDYSSRELVLCRQLMRRLFSVANRGAHISCMVVTASQYGLPNSLTMLTSAEELLQEIDCMSDPFWGLLCSACCLCAICYCLRDFAAKLCCADQKKKPAYLPCFPTQSPFTLLYLCFCLGPFLSLVSLFLLRH